MLVWAVMVHMLKYAPMGVDLNGTCPSLGRHLAPLPSAHD